MENIDKPVTEKEISKPNQEVSGAIPVGEHVSKIESPTKKPSSKLTLVLVAVMVFLVLSAITGIFIYKSKVSQQFETKIQTGNTNVIPSTAPANQQSYKAKNWVLKRNTSTAKETVLTLPDIENQIVHWGDLLIYGSGDYSSNVQLYSYNLKTGEKKTIYDQASREDFQGGRNNRYVSDLQAINNTLFFSIGGYLTSGASFYQPLPPIGQPQKLAVGANGRIQYWKNHYWIINGEGDACWGTSSYSLIDLASKKVTPIATSTSGCYEGEEFVDIDKREKMIMAFHTAGSGEGGEGGSGIYQYVIAIPLTNPTAKEGIIAKQDMPSGITSVVYLTNSDQLLLVGKEKYLFDFSSKSINKTDMTVPTPTPSSSAQNKTFKDKIKDLNLPIGYEFVLE